MKIVFFGASRLGFDCCKTIAEAGYQILSIYTLPASFDIKYKEESNRTTVTNSLYADFQYFQDEFFTPVHVVSNGIKEHIDHIERLEPDLFIIIGWYFLIPESLLRIAAKGCIGIHGSLLPKYRGNAPLVWAMIQGEKKTGVTLFYFSDGIDNGDIIGQESFSIEDSDMISDVLSKATSASQNILLKHLPDIATDSVIRIKQDDSQATLFPRRTPQDGKIDWNWDAVRIRNFIRAQTRPYPGAFTELNGKRVTIWDASLKESSGE